jgi:hypothetical protein
MLLPELIPEALDIKFEIFGLLRTGSFFEKFSILILR